MNICITNYDMVPQFTGGIKRVSSILAKEWVKDCNVYFMAISPTDNQVKDICGIQQCHLPVPEDILSEKNLHFFIDFVKEKSIDIILHQHSENLPFTELCIKVKKNTGAKLITTRHFAITYNNDSIKNSFFIKDQLQYSFIAWIKSFLFYLKYFFVKRRKNLRKDIISYKYLIYNSDKFVLLCNCHIKDLKKQVKLNNDDINKLCAINNPIEISKSANSIKKKIVLWCGRVEFGAKRTDRILKIWKDISHNHSDWELIIMGSGNIELFRDITKKKAIQNVTFTGHCNPSEYYKQGSILCMTSSTEGLPMVILEAQMYGCIPVAYNSFSSLDEIITNGVNGFKIKPYDKKEFSKRLGWLMENEEERNIIIKKCQQSVKRFDVCIIAQQWIDLFNEIL